MLSGCLVVPKLKTEHRDFPNGGWPHQTPRILFICHSDEHRAQVASIFRDKAMFIIEGAMITGWHFEHIVHFEHAINPTRYDLWFNYNVRTALRPNGEITLYRIEDQLALGIMVDQ